MAQLNNMETPVDVSSGDQQVIQDELRALLSRIDSLQRPNPAGCMKLINDYMRFIYDNERWTEDFFSVLRIYQGCWQQLHPREPLEDVLSAQLSKAGVPVVLAGLLRGSDSSITWNADYFKELALVNERRADFETALSYADLARKIDPVSAQVCVVRGWILCDLDREDDALEMFRLAYELNPKNHSANNALAKHFAATNPERALEFANRAIELAPGEAGYHETKAKILARIGDLDGAATCFDAAMIAAPYDAEYPFQKAGILLQQQKEVAAITLFRKALALNDRHVPCLLRLAELYEPTQPDTSLIYINTVCSIEGENAALLLRRAQLLQKLGETIAAAMQFEHILEIDPRSAEALAGLGGLALLDDPAVALRYYDQAIAVASDPVCLFDCHMGKGRAFEKLEQTAQAIKEFKAAVRLDQTKATPLARLAALHEESSPREAEGYYEKALALVPDNAFYLAALGELVMRRHDNARAMELLMAAVTLDPANARLHVLLGRLLEQSGSAASALEHYRQAVSLEPDSPESAAAYASIARLILRTDPGASLLHINSAVSLDPKSAEYCYLKSKILLALGDNSRALTALRNSIEQDGKHGDAIGELAQLTSAESLRLALNYLSRAAELAPQNVDYLVARAELLMRMGEENKARVQFVEILRKNPKSAAALFGMARCIEKTNAAKALELVNRAIAIDGGRAEYHAFLAGLPIDIRKALEAIARARSLDSGNVEYLLLESRLLEKDGQTDSAVAGFRRVLSLEPNNIEAHRHLGLIFCKSQPVKALEHLDIAVEAEPADPTLHVARGQALAAVGRIDEAAVEYQECVDLGGGGADVLFTLAGVLASTLPETALGFCRRAIEKDNGKAEYFLLEGKLYAALEMHDPALDACQRATQLDPGCHEAAEYIARELNTLEAVEDALQSNPGCAVCLLLRARVLQFDCPGEALASLSRAAKADPGNIDISRMTVRILERERSHIRLALERRRLAKLLQSKDES